MRSTHIKSQILLALLVLGGSFLISEKAHAAAIFGTFDSSIGQGPLSNPCDLGGPTDYGPVAVASSSGYIIGTGRMGSSPCTVPNPTNYGITLTNFSTGYPLIDGSYYVYWYSDQARTNLVKTVFYSIAGGAYVAGSGFVFEGQTQFYSFTIDQAHGLVNATGYWSASTSPAASQQLYFVESTPAFSQVAAYSYVATTTGNFNFSFPYVDSSFKISATSTSYSLGSSMLFSAKIFQNYASYDPFNASGTEPVLLAATSTSLAATSTVTVDTSSSVSLSGLPEPSDCGVTALTGCIKNAAVWLFYPTSASIAQWSNLSLRGKFPFEYAYQIGDIRQTLLSASSTAATSVNVPLWKLPSQATSSLVMMSSALIAAVPYSATVKTIVTAILYLMMAEYVYYRILKTHDTNTP